MALMWVAPEAAQRPGSRARNAEQNIGREAEAAVAAQLRGTGFTVLDLNEVSTELADPALEERLMATGGEDPSRH